MAKDDAIKAIGRLMAAFRTELTPESVSVYVENMLDIEPGLLLSSVTRLIEKSKFFPAISEIREAAARIAGLLPATSAESMAIVRAADVSEPIYRRDGSFAYTERYWRWPNGISRVTQGAIEETLSKVGESRNDEGKPIFGWEKGFEKTYESIAQEIALEAVADLSMARLPTPRLELVSGDAE